MLGEIRGRAFGVTILAFFALGWTGWGTSEIVHGSAQVAIMVIAVVVSVALAGIGWMTYRAAAAFAGEAAGSSVSVADAPPEMGRSFGVIVAIEFIGLGIIAGILGGTGHPELIPAVICLGVGIHFFPLARLFHLPAYWVTGSVLCLIAVATFVLAPLTGTTSLWTALPGIGSAIVLYATCVELLRQMRAVSRASKSALVPTNQS